MFKKKRLIIVIFFLFSSCILTYLISNIAGKKIENFEARIYQILSGKKPQFIQLDPSGVPFVVYEGRLGKQYNTVTVAEEALKHSHEENLTQQGIFFSCIGWLKNNYSIFNDSSIIYLNNYDWPVYQMTSPWRSAMNQGRAAQAFTKAFEKTRDSVYLDYARRSLNTLFTEVKNGGVTYKDSTGYWFEEYADDSAPQSRVLNGMIVTLQGIYDYYRVSGDKKALFLFDQGVNSLKKSLPEYDNMGHSYYDISKKPSSPWYHKFHIILLDFLYSETNDPVFKTYREKWSSYKEPSYLASLIRKPNRIGLFTVFTIFVSITVILYGIWMIFHVRKPSTRSPSKNAPATQE